MLRFEKNFNETAEYYALETDDGLIMNLGVNPLLQIGLDETRRDLITNILNPNLPKLLYIGFKLVPQIPYKIGV